MTENNQEIIVGAPSLKESIQFMEGIKRSNINSRRMDELEKKLTTIVNMMENQQT